MDEILRGRCKSWGSWARASPSPTERPAWVHTPCWPGAWPRCGSCQRQGYMQSEGISPEPPSLGAGGTWSLAASHPLFQACRLPRPPGRSSPASPSPVPGCAPSLPTTLRGSLLLHNNTPPRARSPAPPIAHLSSRLASPWPSRPASEPPLLPTPVPLVPPLPQPHQLTGLPGSLSPHYPASLSREPDPLKGPFIHWRAVCLLPAWGSRPLSLPGPEQELLGGHTVSKWMRGVDVRLCREAL